MKTYGKQRVCVWCGEPFVNLVLGPRSKTREHMIPRVYGGPNTHPNIQAAHLECNNLRGNSLRWVPFVIHGRPGRGVIALVDQMIPSKEAIQ